MSQYTGWKRLGQDEARGSRAGVSRVNQARRAGEKRKEEGTDKVLVDETFAWVQRKWSVRFADKKVVKPAGFENTNRIGWNRG
jgi:hypothetical protein